MDFRLVSYYIYIFRIADMLVAFSFLLACWFTKLRQLAKCGHPNFLRFLIDLSSIYRLNASHPPPGIESAPSHLNPQIMT